MFRNQAHPAIQETKELQFEDATIRRAFIRKVYSILMLQLLITLGFVAVFTLHEPTKQFARENFIISIIALCVFCVLAIAMACSTKLRRKTPMNFFCLFAFTIAAATLLGFSSSLHEEKYVMLALGITTVICFSLTLFAFQTKIDFTGWGTYLFVALIGLTTFGFVTIFWHGHIITLLCSACGAMLFSLYLVYDTQLMIGGKDKHKSLSPEEYIYAALNLYLDVIIIFWDILTLIGGSDWD